MKNIYITILTVLLLVSCSGDDTSIRIETLSDIDEIPTIPNLVFPTNNLTCTNFNLSFEWNPATSDISNTFTYVIEISTQVTFDQVLFSSNTIQTTIAFTLEKGTTYFWRIKATDNNGNESPYSAIQSFFTEPDPGINTIPFAPELLSPALRSTTTGDNITLHWNATDADGDVLVYDIYFGETDPPVLLTENHQTTSIDVDVSPNTKYYWRILVKDDKQGVAIGQVWNFKTD